MALMKSKLNTVPQRNKAVAFGFCREEEIKWNDSSNIPQLIKYLCLLYLNQNKDEFVVDGTCKDIDLNGNCITHQPENDFNYNISWYLKNTVQDRKHIWKFKINKFVETSWIGIYDTKFDNEFHRDRFFDYSAGCGIRTRTGYGLSFRGTKTNLNHAGCGEATGLIFSKDDIIEIILDFNKMKLYVKMDDKCVELFDIDKGEYRA
eukprot:121629_1